LLAAALAGFSNIKADEIANSKDKTAVKSTNGGMA
jgi:hypothetical protein